MDVNIGKWGRLADGTMNVNSTSQHRLVLSIHQAENHGKLADLCLHERQQYSATLCGLRHYLADCTSSPMPWLDDRRMMRPSVSVPANIVCRLLCVVTSSYLSQTTQSPPRDKPTSPH